MELFTYFSGTFVLIQVIFRKKGGENLQTFEVFNSTFFNALFNFDQTSTLNALIWACTVICFPGLFKDFIKYSGLVWNFFCQKLGLFFVIFVYLAYWWQSSFIMNRNIIFYPALFLVSFAKFLHARLFRTARLFSFCQNYTLHAYSGLRVIRVPSWIFIEYSCPS